MPTHTPRPPPNRSPTRCPLEPYRSHREDCRPTAPPAWPSAASLCSCAGQPRQHSSPAGVSTRAVCALLRRDCRSSRHNRTLDAQPHLRRDTDKSRDEDPRETPNLALTPLGEAVDPPKLTRLRSFATPIQLLPVAPPVTLRGPAGGASPNNLPRGILSAPRAPATMRALSCPRRNTRHSGRNPSDSLRSARSPRSGRIFTSRDSRCR